MKPKEWFASKWDLELVFKHDDNLVRTDIRIWKTYIPQGGKEKRNG